MGNCVSEATFTESELQHIVCHNAKLQSEKKKLNQSQSLRPSSNASTDYQTPVEIFSIPSSSRSTDLQSILSTIEDRRRLQELLLQQIKRSSMQMQGKQQQKVLLLRLKYIQAELEDLLAQLESLNE